MWLKDDEETGARLLVLTHGPDCEEYSDTFQNNKYSANAAVIFKIISNNK